MRRPNILLVSIDTLRADHVSCYGYARPTTPRLDELAGDGARFARAYSTAVWTPPAHSSMLTGLYPTQHGVVDENRLDDGLSTIAEVLSRANYKTLGVVNNSQVGDLVGLNRGHGTFHEVWKGVRSKTFFERGIRALHRRYRNWRGLSDHGAARTNEIVKAWLEAHAGGALPFYAFVHYIDPHNPLSAPRPFKDDFLEGGDWQGIDRKKLDRVADNPLVCFTDSLELTDAEIAYLKGLYDGEIAYTDHRLGELFDCLKRIGAYDDTLIIVTADHGEHFGEHGMYSHVSSLYEEIVHVPLIVKYPAGQGQSGSCDALVQAVDIVPTIAHVAGVAPPNAEKLHGTPLLASDAQGIGHDLVYAEWEGRVPFFVRNRVRDERAAAVCERFLQPFCMVRDEQYKYIMKESGDDELYDLNSDPGEATNIVSNRDEVARGLKDRLTQWKQAVSADAPEGSTYTIDSEIRRHLEDLGYM